MINKECLSTAFAIERKKGFPPIPEPEMGSLANALARRNDKNPEVIGIMTQDLKCMAFYGEGWYVFVDYYSVSHDDSRYNCSIQVPMTDSEVAYQQKKGSGLRTTRSIVAVPAHYVKRTEF